MFIGKSTRLLRQVLHQGVFCGDPKLLCQLIGQVDVSIVLIIMTVGTPVVSPFELIEAIVIQFAIGNGSTNAVKGVEETI
ncbi:MAG TPA: hypothetical protein VK618_03060 [Flavitalea sp.]|nr:hypothetical protein [Flavitalea sp.]